MGKRRMATPCKIGENDSVTTTSRPNPEAEWWTTKDVAAYLGIEVAAVSSYRRRGQMPAPDQTIGTRTHVWKPRRIIEWHESRGRAGVGGRPRASKAVPATVPTPEPDDISRWNVHGRTPLYESEWIKLYLTDVELPDGQRFEHHTVWMPTAAMTAVLNDELTHVLLLWRHRFVPDLWNWELPGGLVDEGEEPADAAAREIEEETGYRPRNIEHLVTFEPMIGMVNTPHHVFIARGAELVGEPTEKTEMQRMEWVPLMQVPALIAKGQVSNSGTLVALLHVLAISGPKAPYRS
ncbi:ADP-ribose pyrophosphatase YjhB (NUDIX family) [Krasilnikovia cinnamomea]|uniref:ADP-ribose pyrophosphatase YjhB (NUDIX family) n=1 Tax=Krasilnikovia cinnamomea TaxID=349313 RepID=A0A4Q7ZL63_9ACTN|nr:NUDIX domain-containing protein [Krasilnikovia cinnamomea]RZU51321.1 ADP-ribose pyrophosphatase YjhB (NUDIX family) [Krasilnikovia cinnamomea]